MKRIHNYIFILVVFFCACNDQQKQVDDVEAEKIIAIETQGLQVSHDSISLPDTVLAGQPELLTITETTVLPYSDNIHPLKQPTVVAMDQNYISKNQISLSGKPIIKAAISKTVACILPEPIVTSSLRFKDDATHNIQYIDVAQGLSSSYVRSIFQDKFGNIWICTSNGISKYDGRSIVDLSEKNNALKNSNARLKEDKDGNIWTTSSLGLIKYNGKFLTIYDTLGGLPDQQIGFITFDKNGTMWFYSAKGLTRFDGNNFTTYTKENGYDLEKTISIFCDASNTIWCGSVDNGVYSFNGKSFTHFNRSKGLIADHASSFAQDKDGNIWISGDGGATKFTGHSFEHYCADQGLISRITRNVMVDSKGNIWFSAYRGGMSCFDGKNFTWFTEKEGLTVNTVDALMEDKNGNIWAGTDGGGLCRYSTKSFQHFTDKEMLNRIVMSINEDSKNTTWFGTYDEGLCKYNGKSIIATTEKPKCIGTIVHMFKDSKNNLWFVNAARGLIKYDGQTFKLYTKSSGLSSNNITKTAEDKEGNIWIGTNNNGAMKFDGNCFITYGKAQGLNDNNVNDIVQDKEGNMWFATTNGITKFSGQTVTSFTEKQGLALNHVRNLLVDKKGNLWIGTANGGINKYDGKFMMSITKNSGLSNNFIRSMVEDLDGSLKKDQTGIWASTDYGIDHLILKDNSHSINDLKVITYDRADGLRGEDFCSNSGFMDSKGRAWWGSVKGLTTLQTTDLPIDRDIPDVHLDHIALEQNYIDFNSLKDSIDAGKNWFIGDKHRLNFGNIQFSNVPAFRNYPEDLVLPYNINNITFNYSAINWLSGHKIRYQYFLEGSDKDWHPLTSENKAVYTDLDHGVYTFKVRARGVLEVWSKPLEYRFVILPPWWQTLWAYIIYAIAFISGVIIYLNWRTRALLKRQKELEQVIVERTADVVEEKNKVEGKNKIIEEKQKEIFDSLQYAQQIQKLLLANHKLVNETLPNSFVMFKPKDIVSGDFYWAAKKEDRFYLAVCDSTGHGVPGAFMSLLNINFLNEAINEKNIADPNEVFNYVRKRLIDHISQNGRQDGMDGILICVRDKSKKITYAAANNAPVIIKNNELSVLETDKMPIGKGEKEEPFKLYSIDMSKGDQLYLFTDGYADQFGGPKGKKYKYKPFNDLMLKNNHLPVIEQETLLYSEFETWKGDLEQVDDVCILGIRI